MTKKRALVATLVVVVVAILAAAYANGRNGPAGTSFSTAGGSAVPDTAEGTALAGAAKVAPENAARQASDVGVMQRSVISTGQISLHTAKLAQARADVIARVAGWGGLVSDEQSGSDQHGRITDTTMTLRVPTDRFDAAMASLAGLGKVESQSRQTSDVTTKVIDTDVRVKAKEASIHQIELILKRATRLGDIITIENDLSQRQAELDSLKSQAAYLKDQTSLSTIELSMSTTPPPPAPPKETRGFLAGLERGWHALGTSTAVALTAVGAVLPFAVLLLVLGVPTWLVVRRRKGLSAPSAPAPSA